MGIWGAIVVQTGLCPSFLHSRTSNSQIVVYQDAGGNHDEETRLSACRLESFKKSTAEPIAMTISRRTKDKDLLRNVLSRFDCVQTSRRRAPYCECIALSSRASSAASLYHRNVHFDATVHILVTPCTFWCLQADSGATEHALGEWETAHLPIHSTRRGKDRRNLRSPGHGVSDDHQGLTPMVAGGNRDAHCWVLAASRWPRRKHC
ncbi:hypothetical protein PLICRDRAFT_37000 [Plicaturopsis crispa FD-325 SS-3]|nr:hypothetical protein PLICRDRAFT_37000 [Plicaturopsis crispa FD-325 SS-3]